MRTFRKRYMAVLPFAVYLAAVGYLCFLSPDSIPPLRQFISGIPTDKIIHFIMFLPYPLLAYISFRPDGKGLRSRFLVLAAIVAAGALMAMGVERLQIAAGRNYDIRDFYANLAGIAAGTLITSASILTQHRKA